MCTSISIYSISIVIATDSIRTMLHRHRPFSYCIIISMYDQNISCIVT